MNSLVVIEKTDRWLLDVPGLEVVAARTYLAEPSYAERSGTRVFNLCRTYGYQGLGYYVSLLAAARGHRPLPTVETIQDLRMAAVLRIASDELEENIQRALAPLRSGRFEISIYFGRNLAKRYDRLAQALFSQFPAPFLRAVFERDEERFWSLRSLRLIATQEIPAPHHDFVREQVKRYLARPPRRRAAPAARYDLAILATPGSANAPSDEGALRRFVRAARELGIRADRIWRDDYGRIAEYDALFLRDATAVDHYSYRFARRAAAEGLVVIDDPTSIVRCTNKVYQAELFQRHGLAHPPTLIVHEGNAGEVRERVGLPCVLKQPDSSFSQGVVRVETEAELRSRLAAFLEHSELVVAQRFVPSAFDWRIGVLGGRALFACRYHMARGHWQIVDERRPGRRRYGKVEPVALEEVPERALRLALAATRHIGDGLYGVDVKQAGRRFLIMEVNDNPNVDAGCEDALLGDELYREIMRFFRERLDARGEREAGDGRRWQARG